jgi:hypothetical protein
MTATHAHKPVEATCYVCNKLRPLSELQDCGKGIYRCKKHRSSTILKASAPVPAQKKGRVWVITIPEIKIRIEEE